MKKWFLFAVIVITIIISISTSTVSAQVPSSTILPTFQVSAIPSQADFLSKSQSDLLKNFPHYAVLRQNGEKVDGYFLYDSTKKDFVMIFYFEDKTNGILQNYRPFNSDYFGLFLKTDTTQERYIFAERNGNGCMFPVQHLDDYWAGKFSGCEGGATIVKKTDNGWAVYVKFFKDVPNPLTENNMIKWVYGDIQVVQNNIVKKIQYDNWPQSDYARLGVVSTVKPNTILTNSGKINISDFLYTPTEVLTTGLQKIPFSCANDIIRVSTDLTNYNSTYHIARITASLNSETQPSMLYLRIYNDQDDVILKESQQWSNAKDALFLADLSRFPEGVYSAVVQYGTNGAQATTKFALGKSLVQNTNDDGCYFYLVYDRSSRNLSLLANIKDITNTQTDGFQIFVDRNGDDVNELNTDDVSYIVQQTQFGATVIGSNGTWLQDSQHEKTGDGRFKILPKSYQVLINVPDVSEKFRFALEQTDSTSDGIKTSRYPLGSFSTVPSTWSPISLGNESPRIFVSDKWKPDEIVAKQTVNVNLVLVGNSWNATLKDKVLQHLDSSYYPIISSEMTRAGIQYDYNYNFISASDKSANDLFSFMKKQATDVKPFYGEHDFKNPWGIALWIQNNHTEWVDNSQSTYKINYKLIDADKMEEYIQNNIISSNPSLSQPNSANLVFLADGLDKVNFLHNYKLQRYDSASKATHNAVGLMGYGGKYNFYFFDLYAVPWGESFENPQLYDKKLQSFATDLLDIKSESSYARLVSDYTNNATNLLITPSYIYPPVYKKHYTLDLIIVHKPSSNIGSLNSLIDFYIDQNDLKSQLQSLIPYSEWDIKVTLANSDSRDLPDNFKQAIKDIKTVTPFQDLPSYTIDILNSQSVAKAIAQWPTTSMLINSQEFENIADSSLDIPAITIVSSSADRQIFIDSIYETGLATANLNDPTQACCAIGVTDGNTVWTQKVSATRLVMHEVGHTLGLMHPFIGYSADGKFFQNDYFNWYNSVMGYNQPPYGCGIWFSNYVSVSDIIDKTCGISGTVFTKFERDNLSRGVTSYLIKAAETNVYMTMLNLELNGEDPNNIQGDLKNTINDIQSKLDKAKNSFMQNDILSEDGAMNNALAAALESENLAKLPEVNYQPTVQVEKLQIPDWVKSTAQWWSSGKIGDSDFISGIQYLIKQRIISVPNSTSQGPAETSVPAWIKNNAGWWASGQISNDQFVQSLQYLINHGIIRI